MRYDRQLGLDPDDSLPTRRSLLSRLKNWDDSESWNDFFRTYWKLIFNFACKAGLTEAEAQDVVQQTVIEVSQRIAEFKHQSRRGSFKKWLLQLTRWRIQDQFRKRLPIGVKSRQCSDEDDGTDLLNRVADPAGSPLEQAWDAEWEKNLFNAAVERVKARANPKAYQIFDACVFQEWPLEKVRTLFDVSTNHIRVAKSRVSEMIRTEMKRLEKRVL
jgi:RNA polymerase sigma-70 factor (ECF subfamily)